MPFSARLLKSLFASKPRRRPQTRSLVQVESLEGRKLLSHASASHHLAHHAAQHHGQVEVQRHDHRLAKSAMNHVRGAMQRRRNDDPANDDAMNDKNQMNRRQDDPANHDAMNDRNLNAGRNADDPANHDVNDDNATGMSQTGHDDSGSHGGGKGH